MGRREPSIFEILMDRPWWISAAVALFVYVTMAIVLPGIAVDNIFFRAIVSSMPQAAPYVASLFLIPIPFSIVNSWRKRQLVDRESGIQFILSFFAIFGAANYEPYSYAVAFNETFAKQAHCGI